MQKDGQGLVLNQFGNPDNVEAHYLTTGPRNLAANRRQNYTLCQLNGYNGYHHGHFKVFKRTESQRFKLLAYSLLKVQTLQVSAVWPKEYLPTIFDPSRVDRLIDIPQIEAEKTCT